MIAALEDYKTDENDYYLNLGILMLNFYGVLSERSGAYGKWEIKSPSTEIDKPEGSRIIAYIHI